MTKPERCEDCLNVNIIERREADAKYRGIVLTKLEGYDKTLTEVKEAVVSLTTVTQTNFNKIYFRMGMISGSIGLICGSVGALAMLHLHK